MLEQKDLEAIAGIVETKVTDIVETKVTDIVETKVTDIVETKVTDIVETKVTDIIETKVTDIIETKVTDIVETKVTDIVETKVTDIIETKVTDIVDTRVRESERLLLGEIVRTQNIFEKRFQKIEQNIEELKTYYNIVKIERDNTSMLMQLIKELQKDVEELKARTA